MKILLLTPPLVQLNTPYPATAYLSGFLRGRGQRVAQADAGLMWVLRLLSPQGLARLETALSHSASSLQALPSVRHFLSHYRRIVNIMGPVLALLQGRDGSLVHRIAARALLPEGPRFSSLGPSGHEDEYLEWAFGSLGIVDKARYFATLFVEDVADAIRDGVDPHFGFARYGESLATSQPCLDPLLAELGKERATAVTLDELTCDLLAVHKPQVVGMSLPFPGNVLGALRMAKAVRACDSSVKIVWGGGYVNTELRELSDPRLFELVDAVTYDDGEQPLSCLLEHWRGERSEQHLLRTRVLRHGEVSYVSDANEVDVPLADTGTPTYEGLPLGDYLSLIDMLNPMHRLWSDTRWNKLTVAHGCYWKKCSFCDTSLDYIRNYQPAKASVLVDRIDTLIAQTGGRGFHFVDEAAPPAGLRAMAEELVRRGTQISWWANIRFEKSFTPALCRLLADSGCIAVSGGLEVASDRLLKLMRKGVTVEQVARVTRAFADAGIRVHAYLMYGFATESAQETIDSLEYVRQLFVAGCLDSAFWHRLAVTAHAPLGQDPAHFGIRLLPRAHGGFARNDLPFVDPTGCDHDRLGEGLKKAVYNYMLGLGLDEDVRTWFGHPVPRPSVPANFIESCLRGSGLDT